ncbi:DUF1579 domain-containing protein [Caulobacter sp.]|uniref:DUF1579 domain-containing protein n=1 Tax=Caulobacter sp. TaxID=78 RepID=UPI001B2A51A0|nr:DUF1579 domain-containing protein [Caulobacter sp.]MBO9545394.1 DUF1579 domain-containing protein [Caulobacter sp.]
MNRSIALGLLAALLLAAPAWADQDNIKPKAAAKQDLSGLTAFDLRVGKWKATHRRLKERLVGDTRWETFTGEQVWWKTMNGQGNADDNLLRLPDGDYWGLTTRAYDPATGEWAIWWLDARKPGVMDTPVKGRFVNGVGTFYADDTLRGKPIKVRFTWSNITATGAHWEQAFSPDGGRTWEVNWYTDFEKIG